ncbi:MAG: acs [Massilia sp.]|nr:acs [Massilia sp.]
MRPPADEQLRGGKQLPLKSIVGEALALGGCDTIRDVIVYQRTGGNIAFTEGRDLWLRLSGSVGEPINPEAWMWYYKNIGGERCPIVDTFWQTETGGHMITPLPGATPMVPGSCTLPLPGIMTAIVDAAGADVANGQGGIWWSGGVAVDDPDHLGQP